MIRIIQKYLIDNNYNHATLDFKDNYESHPNYPSLFAITDTLSLLHIENIAANVPKNQLAELPTTFLGYLTNKENTLDLALISRLNDNKIKVVFEDNRKETFSNEDFKSLWNGVVAVIEPNENKIGKTNASNLLFFYLAFGLIGLFFLKYGLEPSIESISSYVVYVIGFVISVFIIQEKLGKNQENISKLCTFSETISCDSVIKSTNAKITNWLDFSDLPILFFSGAILATLIEPLSYISLNAISLLSIPVVIYSIWLQKVKLKKWCVLCLSVSFLLVLQASFFLKTGFAYQKDSIISTIIALVIIVTGWGFIKHYLVTYKNLESKNKDLKRFKRNYAVFEFLQQPLNISKSVSNFASIEIGNKLNPINISLVLSPSCGHCDTAFMDALDLYQSNTENIQLSIFYNLNSDNKDNPYLDVAKNVLQINRNSSELALEALLDWHIKKLNLKDWLLKWKQKQIDQEVVEHLKSQYAWCLQNEFNYTPVKILNNKVFPKDYSLKELKYFILEIKEAEQKSQLVV